MAYYKAIRDQHKTEIEYTMSEEAMELFAEKMNELQLMEQMANWGLAFISFVYRLSSLIAGTTLWV